MLNDRGFSMSKDNEDKTQSKDSMQGLIQKNPCSICRKMGKPKCPGHAGAGGGGSDNSSNDSDNENESTLEPIASLLNIPKFSLEKLFNGTQLVDTVAVDIGTFKLLFNQSLLTLTFQGKSYLSQREQEDLNELFETVTEEFDLFKGELQQLGKSVDNMSATRINNELTLKFPNAEIFNQFVQRLIDKGYLPQNLSNANPAQAVSSDNGNNRSSLPNPFSMVPRPSRRLEEIR